MIEKDGRMMPTIEYAIMEDGTIYFTEWDAPVLYSMDSDNIVSSLYRLEHSISSRAFGTLLYQNGRIYAAPIHEEAFLVYDIAAKEALKLELPVPLKDIPWKFSSAYSYENSLFFLGGAFPGIAVLDVSTNQLTIWDDWVETARSEMKGLLENNIFFGVSVRVGDEVYAPMLESNKVFVFHLRDRSWRMEEVGDKRYSYRAAGYANGCLWLTPMEMGPLVKWELATGKVYEYGNFPKGYDKKLWAAYKIVPLGDDMLMTPGSGNMMVLVNQKTGVMREFAPDLRGCGNMEIFDFGDRYFLAVRRMEDKNNTAFYIDKETKRIEEIHLTYSETERKYFSRAYKVLHGMKNPDNRYLSEEYQGALEEYLAYIAQPETCDCKFSGDKEENKTTGEKIYLAVKECMDRKK